MQVFMYISASNLWMGIHQYVQRFPSFRSYWQIDVVNQSLLLIITYLAVPMGEKSKVGRTLKAKAAYAKRGTGFVGSDKSRFPFVYGFNFVRKQKQIVLNNNANVNENREYIFLLVAPLGEGLARRLYFVDKHSLGVLAEKGLWVTCCKTAHIYILQAVCLQLGEKVI